MFKKLVFLLFSFAVASVCAMEEVKLTNSQKLPKWVKSADHIRIKSFILSGQYSIQDRTTVLDIKTRLLEIEKIPVEQLKLCAQWSTIRSLWLRCQESDSLPDSANIKEMMALYDTDRFVLYEVPKSQETNN